MQDMPAQPVITSDGVTLHTESTGDGDAILFIHEYAGDHRSWEPQVRRFSRSHRCITYPARGYSPSQVPAAPSAYSQQHAVDDAVAVLDGLGVDDADVIGISMGGFAGLHLAMQHPVRVRSLVVAGTGYGAHPSEAARFRKECEAIARLIEDSGMESFARRYLSGPARVQFQNKDLEDGRSSQVNSGSTRWREPCARCAACSGSGRRCIPWKRSCPRLKRPC